MWINRLATYSRLATGRYIVNIAFYQAPAASFTSDVGKILCYWTSAIGSRIEFLKFIIAFFVVGTICLWGALCVLSIGGWFVHRHEALAKHDVEELPAEFDGPGMTWRDPILWALVFFCWPVLVATSLNTWYCNRYGEPKS